MDRPIENRRKTRNRHLYPVVAALFAVCCAFSAPGVRAAEVSEKVASLLEKAAEKEYAGRDKKAMRLYRKADEAAGGSSREALAGLARAAYRAGVQDEARDAAGRLLELAEDRQTELLAYQLLGSSFYADDKLPDQKRLERAADAYRNAARVAGSEDWTPSYSLALTLEELGRSEEALEILRAAPYDRLPEKLLIPTRTLLCEIRRARAGDPPWPGSESPEWTIYPVEEVDTPPKSLRAASRPEGTAGGSEKMPEFPDPEKKGEVILESIVDEEGCVLAVRVLETDLPKRMVEEQVAAASRALFEPAILGGEPVAVYRQDTSEIYVSVTLELVGPGF